MLFKISMVIDLLRLVGLFNTFTIMFKTITDKSTIKEICDIVEKVGGDMDNIRERIVRIELSSWRNYIDVQAFDKDDKNIRYISVGTKYLQQYFKD